MDLTKNHPTVRLTHIDGKLPNLALMKLAHWHRSNGHQINFSKSVERDMLEPKYDRVYGSAIFSSSLSRVQTFKTNFPEAIVGGTHSINGTSVENLINQPEYENYDYSIYPNFDASIGFTQRGCRLKCKFCVVPQKEGKNRSTNTITNIWRGSPYPKHLHLLDNDFFGQPEPTWRERIEEIIDGQFRVCLNQGINVRLIDAAAAKALASIKYYDDAFTTRRLYTAWDNIGDEERFFKGVQILQDHGIPPTHLVAYMLIGYDQRETWERVLYRLDKMQAIGVRPFPMIYGDRTRSLPTGSASPNLAKKSLADFQRWVIRKLYKFIPFEHYDVYARGSSNKNQFEIFNNPA